MADDITIASGTNMPYNLEAEQSVLGSILYDPACMEIVTEHLTPECFFLPQHKAIFSAMILMYNNSKAIDPVIIADTLAKEKTYEKSGGRDYIAQLAQSVPSTANVEEYAKIVKEQYYLRRLVTISSEIIDLSTSGEADASVILEKA